MNALLSHHSPVIIQLCQKHKVGQLYAFGSVLREDFDEHSDVDFVVSFQGVDLLDYADNYYDFKFSLEQVLNREVDLLEQQAIRNPYLMKSINTTKQLVYG